MSSHKRKTRQVSFAEEVLFAEAFKRGTYQVKERGDEKTCNAHTVFFSVCRNGLR